MNESFENCTEFLTGLLADMRFDVQVSSEETPEGLVLDIGGEDAHLLRNEGGEMLDALETILFQAFGRYLDRSHRVICDAEGFRQIRKAELHAMARFAAQSVRKNGRPFTFGTLNSTERRVIHLTLQAESDLQSESVGVGKDRRLQVKLK